MFHFKTLTALSVVSAVLLASMGVAQAGGFGKKHRGGAALAKAYAKTYANLNSKYGKLKVNNFANIKTTSYGKITKAEANAGNNIYLMVNGSPCKSKCGSHTKLKSFSAAKSKIYIKGKKIFGKAQAVNYVQLYAKGGLLFDYESDAYAIGNYTPAGVYVDAATFQRLNLTAKGYVHLSTGQIAKASAVVK